MALPRSLNKRSICSVEAAIADHEQVDAVAILQEGGRVIDVRLWTHDLVRRHERIVSAG